MITDIAERFSTQCATVVSNSYDTCGTITRASIAHLTPAQLEAMFVTGGLFADLDAWFHTAIEMKACGTKVNGMYEWIMSGADREKFRNAISPGMKIVGSGSMVMPFVLAKQDSVLNKESWTVSTGSANSAYTGDEPTTAIGTATAGPLSTAEKALGAAGDRVIRVISRYGVDLDEKWFNPRTVVHIFSRAAGTGVTQNGAWRILASAMNTTGTYVDLLVTSENGGSTQPFAAAPTAGVMVIGVNNVNDYESWCRNLPNPNVMKRVPFWHQTMRRTRCVDQFYREFLKRMTEPGVNRAFSEFGDVSAAERNRQDEEEYQRRFVRAFFFQKPISGFQTLADWQSLTAINTPSGFAIDPGTGGKLLTYRANFIGVLEQLWRCDMVRDLMGNPLNFYEWLRENYRLMRARASRKDTPVTSIDWYTSTSYAARLNTAFLQYWKQESLEQLQLTWAVDAQKDRSNILGFSWNSYRVNWPSGLTINIVTHEYFDDLLSAYDAESIKPAGNLLLALDIGKPGPQSRGGSIYWAHIKSNRKPSTKGELSNLQKIDSDWACVMESVTEEVTMQSDTGTVVVECPQDNRWIWGIADAAIVTTGETTIYGDLY